MPIFDRAKPRLGNQLGSAATTGEETQNRLCAGHERVGPGGG